MAPKPKKPPAADTAASEPQEAAQAAPKPRSFRLRPDPSEDGVTHLNLGDDPVVSLDAGETFTTADEKLAERLAAEPLLEETT